MNYSPPRQLFAPLLFLFCLILAGTSLYAQYTIIGQNSFGGTNFYGPMTTNNASDTFFSRHAYIYPEATLGQLRHGDTIRSIEFFKSGTNGFTGAPIFRVYMAMSANADFGSRNLHWPNEAAKSGTVKVYEGNPATVAGTAPGFKRFDFNTGVFVFDSTKGNNLEILVEFIQYSRNASTVGWVYENDFTVPYFVSSNETKLVSGAGTPTDSTNASNVRKPYIKINYPRYDKNLEVNNVYCLGTVPTLMGRADTVMAIVGNSGRKTVYKHPFFLQVTGANKFKDSLVVDSIAPFETKLIKFGSYQPTNQGNETVHVFAGKDDFSFDDKDSVRRKVGYNIYSHADPFQGMAGGIGFNGSSGDFVAKFYTDSIIYINQIKVDFAQGGQGFQLGIWEEKSNGVPGKNIYTSDTLTSVPGTYILSVLPRVMISGGYFVGIRQTGTTNVAFAYQPESPIRPNAFFFAAPLGDTAWVPFSPGYDFKFNIQPRIQVGTDVAILRITYPSAGDSLEYEIGDSIAPKATVINYGFVDQKAPFDVICHIHNQWGKQVYGDTASITLNNGDSSVITFSRHMSLGNVGTMRMRVFTRLSGDKVGDNDTMIRDFYVVVRHDVTVENYFDPQEGQKFQMNSDRVGPVVRVVNFGANTKNNIQVTSRIRQGTKIARTQTKTTSLRGSESAIVTFDSFTIPWYGDVVFETFCWGVIDSFHINDTARVNVYVDKSHDIGILSVVRPAEQARHVRKSGFQPYANIRNFGIQDQDSVSITAEIFNPKGKLIYTNQTLTSLIKFSTGQVLLKNFTVPDTVGWYQFRIISRLKNDQDTSNDTVVTNFEVVTANDLAIENLVEPVKDKLYVTSTTFFPSATVRNIGNNVVGSPPVFYCSIADGKGKIIYMDSSIIEGGLAVKALDTVIFKKQFEGVVKDLYHCKVWHIWTADGEKSNDEVYGQFTISYKQSVKPVKILTPQNDQIFGYNSGSIKPKFSIRNDGIEDVYSKTDYYFTISLNGQNVYAQSGSIDSLIYGEEKIVEPALAFTPTQAGDFKATLWIYNENDAYPGDDTISAAFKVVKSRDAKPIEFKLPNSVDAVMVNRTYAPSVTFNNAGDSSLTIPFSVSLLIYKGTSLFYNNNQTITLGISETKTVLFDSTLRFFDRGAYKALAITRLGSDQERSNDTLELDFEAVFAAGIPSALINAYSISPNPSDGKISLRSTSALSAVQITVLNTLGQIIEVPQTQISQHEANFSFSGFASGIYFLVMTSQEGTIQQKVVISR